MSRAPAGPDLAKLRAAWPGHSALARIPRSTLDAWLSTGSWSMFKAGEVLLREGDPAETVHLLVDGCVKVISEPPKGRPAVLAVRGAGSLIGELAALDGDVRSATVVACSRSPVWTRELPTEHFNAVLSRDSVAMSVVTTAVTGKLRSSTRRRIDMAQPPVRRLARVLVELVEEHGTALKPGVYVVAVHLTQVELASLIGMHESTVFRLFSRWRRQGVLESGAPLVVKNLPVLREAAGDAVQKSVM